MICSVCGKEEENSIETFVNTHGENLSICKGCLHDNSHIVKCESCDKYFEYNYAPNYYDSNYDAVCHECYLQYHVDESTDNVSLGWGYKPDPIFFGGDRIETNKLFMGMELETDEGDDVDGLKEFANELNAKFGYSMFWGKEDGSLSDNGIEFVSHPATLEYHKKTNDWKDLLNEIKKAGLKSNDCSQCGIHIHMNKDYLNTEQIHKLDALVNLYSTVFRRFARRINGI